MEIKVKVEDIMTKDVITVTPDTKIAKVANLMFANRFHGIPVVVDGKIKGIITEADFFVKDSDNFFLPTYIKILGETKVYDNLSKDKEEKLNELLQVQAKDIMKGGCVTIMRQTSLEDLLNFFRETKYYSLPVVDESENLVGIVTLSDVLKLVKAK